MLALYFYSLRPHSCTFGEFFFIRNCCLKVTCSFKKREISSVSHQFESGWGPLLHINPHLFLPHFHYYKGTKTPQTSCYITFIHDC